MHTGDMIIVMGGMDLANIKQCGSAIFVYQAC